MNSIQPSKTIVWHLLSNRWNSAITEYSLSAARSLELPRTDCKIENVFTSLRGSPAESRAKSYQLMSSSVEVFSLLKILDFKRRYRQIQPDVIICYGGPEAALALAVSFFDGAKKPRILRFKGQDIRSKLSLGKKLIKALSDIFTRVGISANDKIIVPSKAIYHSLSKGEASRAVVIPLGLDINKFFYQKKQPTDPADRRRPKILIFGRLDPVKGHREFLSIFKAALDRWPEDNELNLAKPELHIAGIEQNIQRSDIELVRTELGLLESDVCYQLSKVEQPHEMMASADLGVIPSLGSEVICRVAEEFLLCGTPIVVSGAGGLAEVDLSKQKQGLSITSTYSYQGMGQKEASKLLIEAILEVNTKPKNYREDLALAAKTLYGFRVMAQNLIPIVLDRPISSEADYQKLLTKPD